jgi:nucleoside-diphosphate-sugar epimerase
MHVFLTGATGYVGRHVATALTAAGHTVTGLARTDHAEQALRATGHQVHRGDLTDPASLRAGVTEADAVVHTAVDLAGGDFSVTFARDRAATEVLLDAVAGTDRPLIYTGGTGVYGDTGDRVVTETDEPPADGMSSERVAIERLVLAAAARGIRALVLRPPMVHGDGGSMVVSTLVAAARTAGAAGYVGDGAARWSFVHVDALADLYRRALERLAVGPIIDPLVNAAAGPSVSMRALAAAIGTGQGVPAESWSLERAREHQGFVADGSTTSMQVSGRRAVTDYGWDPVAWPSVLEDLAIGSYTEPSGPVAGRREPLVAR